jgi:hypothetical protein
MFISILSRQKQILGSRQKTFPFLGTKVNSSKHIIMIGMSEFHVVYQSCERVL